MFHCSLYLRAFACLGWQNSDLGRVDYDSRESVGIQVYNDIHPQEHYTIT